MASTHGQGGGWTGEERRENLSLEEQAEAVAAGMRAKAVFDGEIKRLTRMWTKRGIFIGLIAALAVMIPVTVAVNLLLGSQAEKNSRANCNTNASGRPVGNARALAMQEVFNVATQAYNRFPPEFQEGQDAIVRQDIHANLALLPAGIEKKVHGFSDLVKLMDLLPLIDCSDVIKS